MMTDKCVFCGLFSEFTLLHHQNVLSIIFQVAIRALGFEAKKADVQKIMRDYDKEESGKISLQDFTEVSKSIIS